MEMARLPKLLSHLASQELECHSEQSEQTTTMTGPSISLLPDLALERYLRIPGRGSFRHDGLGRTAVPRSTTTKTAGSTSLPSAKPKTARAKCGFSGISARMVSRM